MSDREKRHVEGGAKGIRHGLVCRPSNRQRAVSERLRVLEIVRERYGGSPEKGAGQRFGPTLAAEQLKEDEGFVMLLGEFTLRSRKRNRSGRR